MSAICNSNINILCKKIMQIEKKGTFLHVCSLKAKNEDGGGKKSFAIQMNFYGMLAISIF